MNYIQYMKPGGTTENKKEISKFIEWLNKAGQSWKDFWDKPVTIQYAYSPHAVVGNGGTPFSTTQRRGDFATQTAAAIAIPATAAGVATVGVVPTLVGMGAGMGAGIAADVGGSKLVELAGGDENAQEMVGDIAGFTLGAIAGGKATKASNYYLNPILSNYAKILKRSKFSNPIDNYKSAISEIGHTIPHDAKRGVAIIANKALDLVKKNDIRIVPIAKGFQKIHINPTKVRQMNTPTEEWLDLMMARIQARENDPTWIKKGFKSKQEIMDTPLYFSFSEYPELVPQLQKRGFKIFDADIIPDDQLPWSRSYFRPGHENNAQYSHASNSVVYHSNYDDPLWVIAHELEHSGQYPVQNVYSESPFSDQFTDDLFKKVFMHKLIKETSHGIPVKGYNRSVLPTFESRKYFDTSKGYEQLARAGQGKGAFGISNTEQSPLTLEDLYIMWRDYRHVYPDNDVTEMFYGVSDWPAFAEYMNANSYKSGGSIHIKKKNRGKFTASAKAAGEGVQEHAHKVMNDPNATPLQKKRANFAIQAKKWHHKHQDGGVINYLNFCN